MTIVNKSSPWLIDTYRYLTYIDIYIDCIRYLIDFCLRDRLDLDRT